MKKTSHHIFWNNVLADPLMLSLLFFIFFVYFVVLKNRKKYTKYTKNKIG